LVVSGSLADALLWRQKKEKKKSPHKKRSPKFTRSEIHNQKQVKQSQRASTFTFQNEKKSIVNRSVGLRARATTTTTSFVDPSLFFTSQQLLSKNRLGSLRFRFRIKV
jgi:hypothetical protein